MILHHGLGKSQKIPENPITVDPIAEPERHVHAEHDPHGAGQGGGADHGAPHQAQLADAVDRQPIGEGLDPDGAGELGERAG